MVTNRRWTEHEWRTDLERAQNQDAFRALEQRARMAYRRNLRESTPQVPDPWPWFLLGLTAVVGIVIAMVFMFA